jgi:hypothetical protein
LSKTGHHLKIDGASEIRENQGRKYDNFFIGFRKFNHVTSLHVLRSFGALWYINLDQEFLVKNRNQENNNYIIVVLVTIFYIFFTQTQTHTHTYNFNHNLH